MCGHWQSNRAEAGRDNHSAKPQLWNAKVGRVQDSTGNPIAQLRENLLDLLSNATSFSVVVMAEKLRHVLDDNDLRS